MNEKMTHEEVMIQALELIQELCKPGQEVNRTQAVDIVCDAWNAARNALQIVKPDKAA